MASEANLLDLRPTGVATTSGLNDFFTQAIHAAFYFFSFSAMSSRTDSERDWASR